jgi:hypothetical protein
MMRRRIYLEYHSVVGTGVDKKLQGIVLSVSRLAPAIRDVTEDCVQADARIYSPQVSRRGQPGEEESQSRVELVE